MSSPPEVSSRDNDINGYDAMVTSLRSEPGQAEVTVDAVSPLRKVRDYFTSVGGGQVVRRLRQISLNLGDLTSIPAEGESKNGDSRGRPGLIRLKSSINRKVFLFFLCVWPNRHYRLLSEKAFKKLKSPCLLVELVNALLLVFFLVVVFFGLAFSIIFFACSEQVFFPFIFVNEWFVSVVCGKIWKIGIQRPFFTQIFPSIFQSSGSLTLFQINCILSRLTSLFWNVSLFFMLCRYSRNLSLLKKYGFRNDIKWCFKYFQKNP